MKESLVMRIAKNKQIFIKNLMRYFMSIEIVEFDDFLDNPDDDDDYEDDDCDDEDSMNADLFNEGYNSPTPPVGSIWR